MIDWYAVFLHALDVRYGLIPEVETFEEEIMRISARSLDGSPTTKSLNVGTPIGANSYRRKSNECSHP